MNVAGTAAIAPWLVTAPRAKVRESGAAIVPDPNPMVLATPVVLDTMVNALERLSYETTGWISVTVVDAAGVVLATLRDDGAAPHTVAASQRKAYTALSTRMPTSQMAKIVSANPDAFGLRQIDGLLILSGGLPIKAGESVVGAIGVSGAPGSEFDEKCGGAGLASIAEGLDAK